MMIITSLFEQIIFKTEIDNKQNEKAKLENKIGKKQTGEEQAKKMKTSTMTADYISMQFSCCFS